MWWVGTTTAIAVPTYITYTHYQNKKNIVRRINKIKTPHDIVYLLQDLCKDNETDAVTELLVNEISLNAHKISEKPIKRLSEFAQYYKDDNGMFGFSTTLLWSCIVSATQDNLLAFSDDDLY